MAVSGSNYTLQTRPVGSTIISVGYSFLAISTESNKMGVGGSLRDIVLIHNAVFGPILKFKIILHFCGSKLRVSSNKTEVCLTL